MASWRWSENRGDNDDDNGDSRSPAGEQEGEELEKGEEGGRRIWALHWA